MKPEIFIGMPTWVRHSLTGQTGYIKPSVYEKPIKIPISEIAEVVADVTGISIYQMKGLSRVRMVADARHLVYYFCGRHGHGLTESGKFFGQDHATVLHAKRNIEILYTTDKSMKCTVDQIQNIFEKWK